MLLKCPAALVFALAVWPIGAIADTYPHCSQIKEMATVSSSSISGRIASIDAVEACGKPHHIIAITLKNKDASEADKSSRIYLAPNSYLMRHKMHLALGDDVDVVAIALPGTDGTTQMTALEITKGEQRLSLRDRQGRPQWSGKQGAKGVAH